MTGLSVLPLSDQVRWHALYKAAPLVIILLYMRTRGDRPVTQSEIAENVQISRNTAATALRKLAVLEAVIKVDHNSGYILADGGRQMLLQLDNPGCSKVEHPSLKESLRKDSKDLKDMKERKKGMLKNCTSSTILSETGILFPGHEVISFGLSESLDADYVIAWLAQAYDQHKQGKISHPWALVYRRLQAQRALPDKKYQADPLAFLPNEYLVALGLAEPDVVDVEPDSEPEIVRVTEYVCTVEAAVYDAWITVQEQLRQDLRKVEYETWVLGTYPVCFDGGVLRIGCRNVYGADWLRDRLVTRVQPALARLLGDAQLRVEFIVATETEEA
jgi:predicted transcriptional regulator